MCFAVNQANKAELDKQLSLFPKGDLPLIGWTPRRWMDGFTYPLMPVILNDRTVELANWGLVPHWTRSDEEALKLRTGNLNAKVENLWSLASWKPSASKKRCVVPINGFFEYQHLDKEGNLDPVGKVTKPHLMTIEGKAVMYLGAIWAERNGVKTFSIVTMPSNTLMTQIHNAKKRMPVIVQEEHIDAWLAGGTEDEIQPFALPRDDIGLVAEPTQGKPKKGEEDQGGLF